MHRQVWHSFPAAALGLVLAFAPQGQLPAAGAAIPRPAAALWSGPDGADGSAVDMEEVKRIYDEGKAKYDTFDYNGATELWTKAYGMLPASGGHREIRNDLAYNIATSQEKAFEIDKDPTHLRQARALLQRFVDEYKAMYAPTPQGREEVKRVLERIAELDARILAAERSPAPPATTTEQRPPMPEAKRRARDARELLRHDPVLSQEYRSGRGMVIGGGVAMGVGGFFGVLALAVGLNSLNWDGAGSGAAIGLGAVGLAGIATGAALIGVGVPKRRGALEEARSRVAVVPGAGRGFGGLSLVGRF